MGGTPRANHETPAFYDRFIELWDTDMRQYPMAQQLNKEFGISINAAYVGSLATRLRKNGYIIHSRQGQHEHVFLKKIPQGTEAINLPPHKGPTLEFKHVHPRGCRYLGDSQPGDRQYCIGSAEVGAYCFMHAAICYKQFPGVDRNANFWCA